MSSTIKQNAIVYAQLRSNRNPITCPHTMAVARPIPHLYTFPDIRAANGAIGGIGIVRNRRLTPSTSSVADLKAADIAAKYTVCKTIAGMRYCA